MTQKVWQNDAKGVEGLIDEWRRELKRKDKQGERGGHKKDYRQTIRGDSKACKVHLGRKDNAVIADEEELSGCGALSIHGMVRRLC